MSIDFFYERTINLAQKKLEFLPIVRQQSNRLNFAYRKCQKKKIKTINLLTTGFDMQG